jgi:hypothetical protein
MIESRKEAKKKVNETKSERLKQKHQNEYCKIQKEVKKALRTDKRTYIDDLAERAEEVASKGEQGNPKVVQKMTSSRD